jgi:acyl transferase domain-containing protein
MGIQPEPVAIIGMSGLFPKAPRLEVFWQNILAQVDGIDDPLPDWGAAHFYDPASADFNKIYTKRGGFLKELSCFDPKKYGIMPLAGSCCRRPERCRLR